ncbi:MAG TPA: oxidoreductase [Candidatus Angelobacter sp.]|nr:oxidoreductase [Candidatus Angelobacter sp.]
MKFLASSLFFVLLFCIMASAQDWTRSNLPTTASFRGLSVVNDAVVWASGTEGTVIRTVNAGKNWSVIKVPEADQLDFRGIHAFDANSAIIISSGPAEKGQAHIYRTTDGGKSWVQVYEQKTAGIFFDAIAFWDHKRGIVLSDPVAGHFALFTTDDGGSTWKQVPPASLPPALPNEGAFAASNSCLAVHGKNDVWFATGGASIARVFRSIDRGKTWTVADTPMRPKNASSGIFSLQFRSARDGMAVGGDYQHPESSDLPNVMRTTDGGRTWFAEFPTDPAGVYFSSVSSNSGKILAAGIKGLWVHSRSWQIASSDNLNTVVAGRNVEWAVGPKGIVLKRVIARGEQSAHVPM